jgi:hypothetical protein
MPIGNFVDQVHHVKSAVERSLWKPCALLTALGKPGHVDPQMIKSTRPNSLRACAWSMPYFVKERKSNGQMPLWATIWKASCSIPQVGQQQVLELQSQFQNVEFSNLNPCPNSGCLCCGKISLPYDLATTNPWPISGSVMLTTSWLSGRKSLYPSSKMNDGFASISLRVDNASCKNYWAIYQQVVCYNLGNEDG